VCDEAELSATERNFFWGRQFLNHYAFTVITGAREAIGQLAGELRKSAE